VTPLDVIARELKAGKRMAFLDARAPSDYLREHIKGAASVPYYDPSPYLDKLPKDSWLVAYCACPHAESQTLAQKLMDAGFKKVTVLDEGIGSWKAKGHPVEPEAPADDTAPR
jgi:cytochrome c oxidase cbb3-type subunit 3/ubiquinol-cytochrome c reductase cytochrome c subunit